ncbi:MBL fold metallo-hydrolase [Heliobacillus mobilis]|uniref:MBL fold metallo-hydrolase n=1 Tax=Heliobacterium mobile TaxID=28064 RepID=A0A6I3SH77_HELMO|nr:MBL fold metallo-hydrolase [Heliobacterium mobile]MTV48188.1 MBL fold metallo-hydrolase [Heliobacterium mobile]
MRIKLIRHATSILQYGGKKFLVDPMLSSARSMAPVDFSPNTQKNPLVELPVTIEELLDVNAVLLTHTHRDHFDEGAARLLPKKIPIFCQPEDERKIADLGFTKVYPVQETFAWEGFAWEGINIIRTGGQHGSGDLAKKMGPVSGYILDAAGEPKVYFAGDTIWCSEIEVALNKYHPNISVLYGGAAQFLEGGPITMTSEDVIQVCRKISNMNVVVVHLEAFNHCLETRDEIKRALDIRGLSDRVWIPENGELITF